MYSPTGGLPNRYVTRDVASMYKTVLTLGHCTWEKSMYKTVLTLGHCTWEKSMYMRTTTKQPAIAQRWSLLMPPQHNTLEVTHLVRWSRPHGAQWRTSTPCSEYIALAITSSHLQYRRTDTYKYHTARLTIIRGTHVITSLIAINICPMYIYKNAVYGMPWSKISMNAVSKFYIHNK